MNNGYVFSAALAALVILGGSITSCATVDPASAQAKDTAPTSAQVEVLNLPYESNLPRFVIAIEPFENASSGSDITAGNQASSSREPGQNIGRGISAQFMTALSHWGNISCVDWNAVTENKDGTFSTRLGAGEIGPFVIRGTGTEFAETSDANSQNRGVSGGLVGNVMSAFGVPGGTAVSVLNPSFESQKSTHHGTVGMDLVLLDGRNARIVRSYDCHGTFTSKTASNNMSIAGIGGGDAQFAASALGQATRAAMNEAVRQTSEALRTVAR